MPIHRLALPTPFPVGAVNAYVLEGEPLTLVDPGPAYPPAREALSRGLGSVGLDLADFEVVFVTHPHIDHYGLAAEVAEVSGAVVAAHAEAVPRMKGFLHRASPQEAEALARALARTGVPGGFAGDLFKHWQAVERLALGVEVDRLLVDGDRVEWGGVRGRILHTPGHSPGSACLYDEESSGLLAGDTLLAEISSNAILEFSGLGGPGDPAAGIVRERSLPRYIESLRLIERLDVGLVLPGHGEPFAGHRAVIAERMKHYEKRKAAIAAVLEKHGPLTVSAIARTLFPDQTEPTGEFLALSEVIGHLDLLEADGLVRVDRSGPVDLCDLASERASRV